MFKEFRDFAMRGNVVDLAVGVIIGSAFGQIVNSVVNDILMPPIGLLLGKVDFANLFVVLSGGEFATLADAQAAGAVTINYGVFITTIINFIIVAFTIFLVIKAMNKAQAVGEKPAAAAPTEPTTKECPYCFTEISKKAVRCPNCTSELGK